MDQIASAVADDLRWLSEALWDGSARVSARGGEATAHPSESFIVLPSARRPRFLVPAGSRRAAEASLRRFNALRPPGRRLARAALGLGLRAGVVQRLARDRLDIAGGEGSLTQFLELSLGREDLAIAIGIGRAHPQRKPVLQVFASTGDPVGFVKVGWDAPTKALVATEANALHAVREAMPSSFSVPEPLLRASWRGLELSMTGPLPAHSRRHPPARMPSPTFMRELGELRGSGTAMLAASPYWRGVADRVDAVSPGIPSRMRDILQTAKAQIEERFGGHELSFGFWHGDLSPWNLAVAGQSLYVIDWEQAADGVPVGFDLLHYTFQVPLVLRRAGAEVAVQRLWSEGLPRLRALGVKADNEEAVGWLYLLEVFLRDREGSPGAAERPDALAWQLLPILGKVKW